jgi:hypothetical protein
MVAARAGKQGCPDKKEAASNVVESKDGLHFKLWLIL